MNSELNELMQTLQRLTEGQGGGMSDVFRWMNTTVDVKVTCAATPADVLQFVCVRVADV